MKCKKGSKGFTLLEVLVALAVAGTGLAGVIKVAGGNAYNAQHLQNKTLAQWVAMNRIAEIQVKHEFPAIGEKKGDAEMADRTWYWHQETKAAPFPIPDIQRRLRQVEINIYADEAHKKAPLATLTTYIASQ